jgi:CelD/BcsL family acetyltransferase involved in cellulose biosynthesis
MTLSPLQVCDQHDPRWRAFVESCPEATLFHHPAWADLIAATYRYRPLVLALGNGRDDIVAGLPLLEVPRLPTGRRLISLPFTDYCPPLARDPGDLEQLTRSLVAWRGRAGNPPVEVRAALPAGPGVHPIAPFLRHVVPLAPDPEQVFRRFHKTRVRETIRHAQRAGLEVRMSVSRQDVDTFYAILWQTRRRLGVPVQPKRFLDRVWTDLIQQGLGFVVLASQGSKAVAATVFLGWNGTLIAKYGGSLPDAWTHRPNNLVYWTAMEWGCRHGYREFDFGRTERNNQGLRDFKRGWGAREESLVYTYLADTPPKSRSGMATRALAQVIQRSPPIVCRALGEALYRYFP